MKKGSGCVVAFFFLEKRISCACLVWSGLNDISIGMPSLVFLTDHY